MKELVQNRDIYRRATFFEVADTSAHQQLFQNRDVYNKGTFSKKVLLQNSYFLEKVKFAEKQYFALPTLSGEPLFQNG